MPVTNSKAWSDVDVHQQSGDQGWWFDFSELVTVGTYYISDANKEQTTGPF